jgi:hypothetical protein
MEDRSRGMGETLLAKWLVVASILYWYPMEIVTNIEV